jgi:hypothetical protein
MKTTQRNRMMLVIGLFGGLAASLMYSAGADEPAKVEGDKLVAPSMTQPFAPSMLAAANNRKLSVDDFEDPQKCKTCHPRQHG